MNSNRPADLSNCVDTKELFEAFEEAGTGVLPRAVIEDLVAEMIEQSTLQPVREIRQNQPLSQVLRHKLTSLLEQTTLDKGQLVNFIDSMRNSVHLTQGPPGTGKSYLGVVVVRALMVIRSLWIMQNPSVGRPPILVLSYKNHATDEFLSDLVKAEPNTFSTRPTY